MVAAPALVVLSELMLLALLLVLLGMIAGTKVIVAALFLIPNATVGWVPWLGGKVKRSSLTIEKKINAELSAAAAGIMGVVGASWHRMAWLVEQTGGALWDATRLGAHALWYAETFLPAHVLPKLIAKAVAGVHGTVHWLRPVVKEITVKQGVSAKQWKDTLRRLGYLSAAVTALRYAVAHAPTLPMPWAPTLPRDLSGIRRRLGRLEKRITTPALIAAAAVAVARLGLTLYRCTGAKKAARRACGMDPDGLEALLDSTLLIFGTLGIRDFAHGMQQVSDDAVSAVRGFVRETH